MTHVRQRRPLHVREPTRLQLCAAPASAAPNDCGTCLGLRVCAPGAVAVHSCRREPHKLELSLRVSAAETGGVSSCAACLVAAADVTGPGRLAVCANVLTNAAGTRGLVRTDVGAAHVTPTPQGCRVRWAPAITGVVELRSVTWCDVLVPLPLPATLLWDATAVMTQLGLGSEHFATAEQLNVVQRFKALPDELRTPELCATVVRQDGFTLGWVPWVLRTPELCAAAVQHDGMALHWVPDALCTSEVCAAAVQQTGMALGDVPKALRTPELCAAAVQHDGLAVAFVPNALRTPELCVAAVQQYGLALQHVPYALRTPALCTVAVQQTGMALSWVPDALRVQALVAAAVQQDGRALRFVPPALRTPALCAAALHDTRFTCFQDVLPEHWTPALLWTGLETSVTRCVDPQWAVLGLPLAA